MSDISIVLRRFKRSNDPKLELPNKAISYIPSEIYGFNKLEVLDLSNNKITSVDAKISQLNKLKILDLSSNNMMMLPQTLLNLQDLQVLKVDNNPLTSQFELLLKQENQVQPRLGQALKVCFGLQDSMEECKESDSQQQQQQSFSQNQGNLLKDIVGKDQEIMNLQKKNSELEQQLNRLSLSTKINHGGLQVSSTTQAVLDIDINDLEIGQQISQGGFSTVHKGFFRGCPVAIKKIFNPNITQDLLDELNNEITMLAQLRHPQIVILMAIVSKAPNLCIVTDFLPRGDLHTLLHKQKMTSISRQQKIDIALQIADVFVFMHANRIAHRDLKSLNILLDHNLQIKLCDFGLARRFEDLNTGTSRFSGTPTYMAFELYQKKAYDHKVDVFAFGTLLWEIFAREVPFGGLEPMEIMEKVQRDDPLPTSTSVPSNVLKLVNECRAFKASNRPEFIQIRKEISQWV